MRGRKFVAAGSDGELMPYRGAVDLPARRGQARCRRPPQWKMALLTWLSLYPIVVALSPLVGPLPLPGVVKIAVLTAISVFLLTWVVMPRVTRLLYGWLYRSS